MAMSTTTWDAILSEGRQARVWVDAMGRELDAFERERWTFTQEEITRRIAMIDGIGKTIRPEPRLRFSRRALDQKGRDLTGMMPWLINLVEWGAVQPARSQAQVLLMEAGRWIAVWNRDQEGCIQYHILSHVAILMRMALDTARRNQGE